MRRCRNVVFVVLALSLTISACSAGGARSSKVGQSKGIVVSPLSSQVADPRLLLSINSLVVEKPVFTSASSSGLSEDSLLSVVREVADETLSMKVVEGSDSSRQGSRGKADGVLKTEILAIEDLKGSSVGGDPAKVAFRMSVSSTAGGNPVWQAHYYYHQEPLADNWLKLGQRVGKDGSGAGWASAESLFRKGVTLSLQDFNSRRDAQFQASKVSSR